jgi:hypothetical protein
MLTKIGLGRTILERLGVYDPLPIADADRTKYFEVPEDFFCDRSDECAPFGAKEPRVNELYRLIDPHLANTGSLPLTASRRNRILQ